MPQERPQGTPPPESNRENLNVGSEIPFVVAEHLNESNQNVFQRMSHKGQEIASEAYEGLYKVPIVNRLAGKMEIAYNQFWADRHEEKAIKFKEKADGMDIQLGAFNHATKEIEVAIDDLRHKNLPGVESLQVKLREAENKKRGILNKKDKVQSKFEARDNKTRVYTNERDKVADKLIGYYNERMAPMEKELAILETCGDRVDLVVAVTEAKHKEQKGRLAGIENRKGQIEEALRGIGMSEKEIKKFEAVKALDKIIVDGREKMKKEMASLAKRKAEINKTAAKVDKKANPYRDRREEFVRIKQGRPVEVNMATRQRGVDNTFEERTKGHTRTEGREPPSTRFEVVPEVIEEEESKEVAESFEVLRFVTGWNTTLHEKYGKEVTKEMVDIKDFIRATGLTEKYKLEPNDFMKILGRYYKLKKTPTGKILTVLNAGPGPFIDMLRKIKTQK